MLSTNGHIALVAADLDLRSFFDRVPLLISAEIHGGLGATVANRFVLGEIVGPSEQGGTAGEEVPLKIGPNNGKAIFMNCLKPILLMLMSMAPHAAATTSLLGNDIQLSHAYGPSPGSLVVVENEATANVGPGLEFDNYFNDTLDVDINDDSVVIQIASPDFYADWGPDFIFHGLRLQDVNGTINDFDDVFLVSSTIVGFDDSRIHFDENNLYVDLGGIALLGGDTISLGVHIDPGPSAAPSKVLIADSEEQFSAVQGELGWRYGYYSVLFDPSDFREMEEFTDGKWWVDSSQPAPHYWTQLGPTYAHPNGLNALYGRTNANHWTVRRWTSWTSGRARIEVEVRDVSTDTNTNGQRIVAFHQNNVVGEVSVPGVFTARTFEADLYLERGDTIDVALDPINGQGWADSLEFIVRIYLIGSEAQQYPRLTIDRTPDGLVVVWPKAAKGFTLQRSQDSLLNWGDVTSGITADLTHRMFLFQPNEQSEFFRLLNNE